MPRTSAVLSDFPKHGHDHRACGSHALAEAEAICHSRGARLTDLRRKVLETIWEDPAPLGAYDILAKLNASGETVMVNFMSLTVAWNVQPSTKP